MPFGALFVYIIYILIAKSEGQEMRPAVVVSKTAGVINSEHVYIGFMGCNDSSTIDLREIVNQQNKTIHEFIKRFEQLERSLSNRTQSLPSDRVTSTDNNCECSSSAKNGLLCFHSITTGNFQFTLFNKWMVKTILNDT